MALTWCPDPRRSGGSIAHRPAAHPPQDPWLPVFAGMTIMWESPSSKCPLCQGQFPPAAALSACSTQARGIGAGHGPEQPGLAFAATVSESLTLLDRACIQRNMRRGKGCAAEITGCSISRRRKNLHFPQRQPAIKKVSVCKTITWILAWEMHRNMCFRTIAGP